MFYTIEELVQQADRDYQGNIAELMIATETELTGRERPEILALMTRNLEVMKDSAYPKIEVMRREVSKRSVCKKETVKAYVTDFLPGEIPGFEKESLADCPVYDFNDLDMILETVLTLSKNSFLPML